MIHIYPCSPGLAGVSITSKFRLLDALTAEEVAEARFQVWLSREHDINTSHGSSSDLLFYFKTKHALAFRNDVVKAAGPSGTLSALTYHVTLHLATFT